MFVASRIKRLLHRYATSAEGFRYVSETEHILPRSARVSHCHLGWDSFLPTEAGTTLQTPTPKLQNAVAYQYGIHLRIYEALQSSRH